MGREGKTATENTKGTKGEVERERVREGGTGSALQDAERGVGRGEKGGRQERRTSRTIMRTKPRAKPMTERLEWRPAEASGMSSSTTT